jgi:hypothetical protein
MGKPQKLQAPQQRIHHKTCKGRKEFTNDKTMDPAKPTHIEKYIFLMTAIQQQMES